MILMVVFAIGDLSFASSPLAVAVFFVRFGKKAMEFWDGGITTADFAAHAYEGRGLVQ